ncbi:MAG: hypothetical protein COT81_04540 [Candidatus Buchananbacteria bacterium CG10_big_fil_rev_8_21_14_0_10_42_9]|uniref:Helix-turn-helix domain-containing protein n=1 Tax=Candidatus Buchananbacteria bacterium CG10_big_fil_rev_8_21_14_0_10_42_9 TaxID=1974526 RepID=A0A2H0W0G0_9BACT|nr:MAG: hypothetical protein COT81_04540 [Candidatus Buchananbacteria bacterium CG10_big_fil_rev_8_21_14_0_10_42_9]
MANENLIRLSVNEAARLMGVSQKTIRRAIAQDELRYIVVRGRYKINFESLLRWSQTKVKVGNKLANNGIGQYVDKWKITNKHYSPRPPSN